MYSYHLIPMLVIKYIQRKLNTISYSLYMTVWCLSATKVTVIYKGADLASPTCHGTGCFFAPPQNSVDILGAPKKNLESLKWHWLILPLISANGNLVLKKHILIVSNKGMQLAIFGSISDKLNT